MRKISTIFLSAVLGVMPAMAEDFATAGDGTTYSFETLSGIEGSGVTKDGTVYRMANKPYHLAVLGVGSACFSIIVSYILSFYFGLTGVVLGATLFDFIMMLYVLPDSCHMLNMKFGDLFIYVSNDYSFLINKIKKN